MTQTVTVGDAFIAARIRAGLSIQELAKKSGVNRRTIYRIENGEHPNPRMSTVRALARVLGADYTELLIPEEKTA